MNELNPDVLHQPCCYCHVTYVSISCVASLPFRNPFSWSHGMVKSPSNAHFRISLEVVLLLGLLGIFSLLFFKYYVFGSTTTLLPYCDCDFVTSLTTESCTACFARVSLDSMEAVNALLSCDGRAFPGKMLNQKLRFNRPFISSAQ